MPTQKCPGCGALNDVSIFVSGTRVRCGTCHLPFSVQRAESMVVDPAAIRPDKVRPRHRQRPGPAVGPPGAGPAAARLRPALRAHPAVEQQEARERARPRRGRQSPQPPPAPAAAQAKPAAKDTQPGGGQVAIPGYEIYEVIGKGGMGKVYRARQLSLDRVVAIKVLNEDLAKHKSFIKRFEKETASLAALCHPNISTIIDRGSSSGVWYFVMEYIDGSSLRQTINRGRQDLGEVLGIFTTLCRAVAHAHQRGVIHRDLKPENVLYNSDGVLKVVDFGLANILDEDKRWSMTRTKVSMGTVNYMAPEQRRDAKHVDHRADIYSLGVMFYELLAGELPLGRFEPPSRHRPGVDPRLDRLVLKMLDFDPDRRPQRLEHVLATLQAPGAGPKEPPSPAAAGPVAGAPVAAEPVAAEPVAAEPVAAEPVAAEPVAAEPVAAEPLAAEPLAEAPAEAPARPPSPSPRRRLPLRLFFLLGGLALLAGGALLVFSVLLHSDLAATAGDLVLRLEDGTPRVNLVHAQQIKHVPPQVDERRDGRRLVRFDFKPSRLRAVALRLTGGDWSWEDRRGLLLQDTCRSAFTINQRAALAAFGPARPAEGLQLDAWLTASESTFDPGDGPVPMRRYLGEKLAGVRVLAQVDSIARVGLGFVDERGDGLQLMLPVAGEESGRVVHRGPKMERPDSGFAMPAAGSLAGGPHRLSLRLAEGRVILRLDDALLLDELSGLPLGFQGRPALACQNARCAFERVEYSQ